MTTTSLPASVVAEHRAATLLNLPAVLVLAGMPHCQSGGWNVIFHIEGKIFLAASGVSHVDARALGLILAEAAPDVSVGCYKINEPASLRRMSASRR